MKKIFSIDRFEGDLAVCISDDDIQVNVKRELLPNMKAHDVFSAVLFDDEIRDVVPMPEERDRRLASNRERLQRLFNRKNNKN